MKNIYNLNSLNRKMKEYEGGRCMMVKKSYDVSTAFYRRGREKAPAVDWHIKGEFEVSLLRAVLVLVSVLTFLAAQIQEQKELRKCVTALAFCTNVGFVRQVRGRALKKRSFERGPGCRLLHVFLAGSK